MCQLHCGACQVCLWRAAMAMQHAGRSAAELRARVVDN